MIILRLCLNVTLFWRLVCILWVVVWYGIKDVTGRVARVAFKIPGSRKKNRDTAETEFPSPRMIRLCMEQLGPSFIKLGQLMSTRADLFPTEYIDEFTKLQDQVPPVPFDGIRRLIETELGQPLDQLFESIDEEAMAAASVAQVHTARLKTGEKVAVKVIRPGIEKRIRKDIQVMYYFAARFERSFSPAAVTSRLASALSSRLGLCSPLRTSAAPGHEPLAGIKGMIMGWDEVEVHQEQSPSPAGD